MFRTESGPPARAAPVLQAPRPRRALFLVHAPASRRIAPCDALTPAQSLKWLTTGHALGPPSPQHPPLHSFPAFQRVGATPPCCVSRARLKFQCNSSAPVAAAGAAAPMRASPPPLRRAARAPLVFAARPRRPPGRAPMLCVRHPASRRGQQVTL
ncbi:MAG: hypothetical protein J3K34DRAFT_214907 [Monoraphidium minutum]|nr:MAG: hypothetical protein J3K34DRAFT_214907 [Monoraphidium minutum]